MTANTEGGQDEGNLKFSPPIQRKILENFPLENFFYHDTIIKISVEVSRRHLDGRIRLKNINNTLKCCECVSAGNFPHKCLGFSCCAKLGHMEKV
jgi:hypothetical protein